MGRPRGPRDKWVGRHSQLVLTGARVVHPSPLSRVHPRGPQVVMGEGTLDGVEEGPQGAWLDRMEVHLGRPREAQQEAAATADLHLEDMGVLVVDLAVAKVGQACMAIGEEEVASIIKVVPVAGEVTTKDLPRRWQTPYLSPTCQRMLERFSWLSILVPLV